MRLICPSSIDHAGLTKLDGSLSIRHPALNGESTSVLQMVMTTAGRIIPAGARPQTGMQYTTVGISCGDAGGSRHSQYCLHPPALDLPRWGLTRHLQLSRQVPSRRRCPRSSRRVLNMETFKATMTKQTTKTNRSLQRSVQCFTNSNQLLQERSQ